MKTKEECYREALEESPYGILTYETALNAMDKYAEEFYKSKMAEKLPSENDYIRESLKYKIPNMDCIEEWRGGFTTGARYVINKLTE